MDFFKRFMIGRNGMDQLGIAFMVAFIVLNIVSLFVSSVIFFIIYVALFIYFIFRFLSKNIAARQKENNAFLRVWNPICSTITKYFNRMKNIRKYKYFKCENCKRTLRVPRGKNKIRITCPHCGNKTVMKT